jgi:VanZ family protein
LKITSFLPAFIWWVVLTIHSGSPLPSFPNFSLFKLDKLLHAGVYGFLALLLMGGVKDSGLQLTSKAILSILCFCIFWGAAMEWMQDTFFPNRAFEWDDMIANSVGAIVSVPTYWLLRRYNILT